MDTSHAMASGKVTKLKGSFTPGNNNFPLDEKNFLIFIELFDKPYELLISNNQLKHKLEFEYFLGSGKYGQNYFTRLNKRFYGLKAHYLPSVSDWSLYPGADISVAKSRPESPTLRCLQCHTTKVEPETALELSIFRFEEWEQRGSTRYKDSFILGVSCESCHGPGKNHVEFPNIKKHIKNPKHFSRERSLQTCSLCHSGHGNLKENFYSYQPGEDLKEFIEFDHDKLKQEGIHSNNLVPLSMSKCFKNSKMTCITCHSPHKNERGDLKTFSKRCISCHTGSHKNKLSANQRNNCIDCHMPKRSFNKPFITKNHKQADIKMRSHHIIVPKRP